MRLVRHLWAPKEGNTDAQFEDAMAVGAQAVVVCDGASAAVFAREWAQSLATYFAQNRVPADDLGLWQCVAALGAGWQERVGAPAETGKARAWWAEEKLPEGSAASLLVVRCDDGAWVAEAVGDACCFIVRADRLKYAFPLTKSRAFGNHPALVPTHPQRLAVPPTVQRFRAAAEPDDRLIVATDAFAGWFLGEYERRRKPWNALPDDTAFLAWLKTRRDTGQMKNDDVTLLELAV